MQRSRYILIVESDDLIRRLIEGWLGEAGHRVIDASQQGGEGGEAPCLVIANVSNPQAAGELIRSLQQTYSAPILLISGRFRRGLGASKDPAQRLGVRGVLPKPFTRAELLSAVRESLAEN